MSPRSRRIVAAGAVVLVVSSLSGRAVGQDTCGWKPNVPGTNGTVYAATTWDPDGLGPQPERLLVGGDFTAAGDALANHIAAWDGRRWSGLGGGTDGPVYALGVYNGELIAAGYFSLASGVSVNSIARWDGTTWRPLGSGMSDRVNAVTTFNGELIAAGDFVTAGGVSANRIARWNGSAWQPLGSGMNGSVRALTVYNGQLIAGGEFTCAGGANANRIARWNDSTWQPLGSGMDNTVNALAVFDGELVAAGHFTTAGGVGAVGISRWDETGWAPLEPNGGWLPNLEGQDPYPLALAIYDDALIVAGSFRGTSGDHGATYAFNIIRWDGTTGWASVGPLGGGVWTDDWQNCSVHALTIWNGQLVAGGSFQGAKGSGYRLASDVAVWDGTTWAATWVPIEGGWVGSLAVYKGRLVAAGHFQFPGYSEAWWDGESWEGGFGDDCSSNDNIPFGPVAVCDGTLYTGGCALREYVDEFAAWSLLDEPWLIWQFFALTAYDGQLIVGGYLDAVDGLLTNNIAALDIGTQTWAGLGLGTNGGVRALTVYDNALIAGGEFTAAGTVTAQHIARWDGSGWQGLGDGIGGAGYATVNSMIVYNGELIAGGIFTTAGGAAANNIARWNGSTWSPLGEGIDGTVRALAIYDGELIVGGEFTNAGGVEANNIARWNGSAWQTLGSGTDEAVRALAVFNGELIVGGEFTTAGGYPSAYWARWGPLSTVDDCNGNGVGDITDIANGTSRDCDGNGVPDECEPDGDGDHVPDACDACPATIPGAVVNASGCPTVIKGDFDRDGDVDATDFTGFQSCVSGPRIPLHAGCEGKDFDGDGDVDQSDFGIFQRCWSGANKPVDPNCAD